MWDSSPRNNTVRPEEKEMLFFATQPKKKKRLALISDRFDKYVDHPNRHLVRTSMKENLINTLIIASGNILTSNNHKFLLFCTN